MLCDMCLLLYRQATRHLNSWGICDFFSPAGTGILSLPACPNKSRVHPAFYPFDTVAVFTEGLGALPICDLPMSM